MRLDQIDPVEPEGEDVRPLSAGKVSHPLEISLVTEVD